MDLIINYIVKYQDSFVYANLFSNNLVSLIQKGISITNLLESSIFNLVYETIEWPSTSVDTGTYFKPYNESIFKLRNKYPEIFPALNSTE